MTIFMASFLVAGCEHANMLHCVDDLTQAGPDRAPITPPNLFALSPLITHAPRSPMQLLTHVLNLTGPASDPCRARVRRPCSPGFSFIAQRNDKKVCSHQNPLPSISPCQFTCSSPHFTCTMSNSAITSCENRGLTGPLDPKISQTLMLTIHAFTHGTSSFGPMTL